MSTPRSTFLPPDISRYNYTSPSSFSHGSLNLPPQIGPLNGQLGPVPSLPPYYPRSFDPPRGLTIPSYNPLSLNQRVEPFNVPQNMPSWAHSQVLPPNFFSSHMPMSNPMPSLPQSQLPSPALPNYPSPSSAFNSSLHDMVPRSYSFPSTFVPLPLQGFQPRPVEDALMPITFTPSYSLASRQVMKIPSFQPNRIPVRTQDLTYFLNNLDATMREMRNVFPSPEFLIPMRGGLGGVPIVFKLNNYTTLSVDPYAFNKVYQTATPKEKEVIKNQLIPTSRPNVASDSLGLVKLLLSDIVHEVYDAFGSRAVNVTGTFESLGRFLPVPSLKLPLIEPIGLEQRQVAHAKIDAFFNTNMSYRYDPEYQPATRPLILEILLPGASLLGRVRLTPMESSMVREIIAAGLHTGTKTIGLAVDGVLALTQAANPTNLHPKETIQHAWRERAIPALHKKIDYLCSTNIGKEFDPKNDPIVIQIVGSVLTNPIGLLNFEVIGAKASQVLSNVPKVEFAVARTAAEMRAVATGAMDRAVVLQETRPVPKNVSISVKDSVAYNRAAFEEYKTVLRAQMEKPHVVDPGLVKIVNRIYKPQAKIGSGSTAAAIRHELATGEKVFDKLHSQKGKNMIIPLEKWLKNNPAATLGDRAAAENIIKDLRNALGE